MKFDLSLIILKDILFGKEPAADKAIVAQASRHIHEVVKNENVTHALITIGGTVFQAAMVGGLLYLAGFGYADTSMLQSMGYATLTAVAQGTVAPLANLRHATEPGALINIIAAPLSQQVLTIADGTSRAAAAAIIQATVTEVSNVLMKESMQEESGLQHIFKEASTEIQSGVKYLWSSLATSWQGIKEVFTPLAHSDEESKRYAAHEDY
jgi:hypothetical protein